jgi:hypothetical protein
VLNTGNFVTISTCDTTSRGLSTLSLQYPGGAPGIGNDSVVVNDTSTDDYRCPNGNYAGAYLNFTVPCNWTQYPGPADTSQFFRLTTGCGSSSSCTATPILTVVSQQRCNAAPPPPPTVPFCGGYQASNTNDATDITNSQLCPLDGSAGGGPLLRGATYTIAPACDPLGVAPPLIGSPLFNILVPDQTIFSPIASPSFTCGAATGLTQYFTVKIPCAYPVGTYQLVRGCSGNTSCTATPNITLVDQTSACP